MSEQLGSGQELDLSVRSVGSVRSAWPGWPSLTRRGSPFLIVGAGALLGMTLLFGLLSEGTFDPGHRVIRDPQALFYDAQARSVLNGRLDVPPASLGGEAISVNGRTYGYFGIGPALLRLPVMAFYPDGYPNLAPWSYLGAFAVEALATLGIWRTVRRRLEVSAPPIVDGVFVFAVLAASPTVFLIARPDVYEEAILWGVAGTLVTFWALLRYFETSKWRWGGVAVLAAAFAVLSRPTVGGAALLAVGVSSLVVVVRDRSRWRPAATLASGAVLGLVAFCSVNYLKFHNVIKPPWQDYANYLAHPKRLAAVERGGSTGIRYLPTNLVQYLRPDTLHVDGRFPWVAFRMTRYAPVLNIGHVHFDGLELPTSISATTPILTVLAVVGSIAILRRPSVLLVPLGASVVAILLIASFFGEAPRYLADFLPWLVVGSCVGLAVFINWQPRRKWVRPLLYMLVSVALIWSVFVSAALAHELAHAYRTHNYS